MLGQLGGKPKIVTWLLCLALLVLPSSGIAEVSKDLAVRYLLATVQAFRTAYVEQIMERVKRADIQPQEDWRKDTHSD